MSIFGKTLLTCAAVALVAGSLSTAHPARGAEAFEFVALGDLPYDVPADDARFERLIAAINAIEPAFSIHVGDIKSGSSPCSDEMLQKVKDRFMTFEGPLVYTPGDNDWTDCHRTSAGGFDPLERLAFVRKLYFNEAESLGAERMRLTRQSDVGGHKNMVENARWVYGGVLFVTVHVVGSNNGFGRNLDSMKEYLARNEANLDWIKEAFALARKNGLSGVVFAFQANPKFKERHPSGSGFADTLKAFAEGAKAFAKPVLLIQGDEHVFIVDQPLKDGIHEGRTLENVYRLQVMGEREIQAVRIRVHPQDPHLFSFRPLIVPENINHPKR